MRAGRRRGDRGARQGPVAWAAGRRGTLATGGVGLAGALLVLLVALLAGGGTGGERVAGDAAVAQGPGMTTGNGAAAVPTMAPDGAPAAGVVPGRRAGGEATTLSSRAAPTVEELLEQGLALAGGVAGAGGHPRDGGGGECTLRLAGDRAQRGAAGASDPVLAAAGGGRAAAGHSLLGGAVWGDAGHAGPRIPRDGPSQLLGHCAGRAVVGLSVPDLFCRLRGKRLPAGHGDHPHDGDGGLRPAGRGAVI